MQKQNEDTYDKMKIDLEEKLYDSLINDSIFVKFFNQQGVKVATIPAYEISAFTSHQGSNYSKCWIEVIVFCFSYSNAARFKACTVLQKGGKR